MSTRLRFWLPWFLLVLFLGITFFSELLNFKNTPPTSFGDILGEILLDLILLLFMTVGVFIALHRPQNLIGWIICTAALIWALSGFALNYAEYSLLTAPGSLPYGVFVGLLGTIGRSFSWFFTITFLLLFFPDGHLPSPRWRPLVWIISSLLVAYPFTYLFDPTAFVNSDQRLTAVQNSLGIPGTGALFDGLNTLLTLALFACAIACIVSVILRFRRAKGDERQQLKWLAYGTIMSLLILVVIIVLMFTNINGGFLPSLIFYLPLLLISISVGTAIMKYRLYNIDIIINRTLVYGILTALLALIYFGLIFILQILVRTLTGQISQTPLILVASTLLIYAIFRPLRNRIQQVIDRRFYRRKYDAAKVVEAFSTTLRNELDLNELREHLISVVEETMQPKYVSLWLRSPEDHRTATKLDNNATISS